MVMRILGLGIALLMAAGPIAGAAEKAPAAKPKAETPAAEAPDPLVNESGWWRGGGAFRLTVVAMAAGYERVDTPAEVNIDFTAILGAMGRETALNATSLRLVEIGDGGRILDAAVPFQFDPAIDYSESTRARGTLIFLLRGRTAADAARRFQVYFDAGGMPVAPAAMVPLILRHESVAYEGQQSYKIVTPTATWYYQQKGGAFAGLLDLDDCDWIGYHPIGGPAGSARGLPNLVEPEGIFHPGGEQCESVISSRGPLKLTIDSQTTDRRWACRWEIYPGYARCTVLKAARPYWFLYEGTPGGKLDEAKDFVLRMNGAKVPLSRAWATTERGPEWVLVGSGKTKRGLFLIRHEAEAVPTLCQAVDGNLALFGFGRKGAEATIPFAPRHFTVGFVEDSGAPDVAKTIESAWRPLRVFVESAQPRYPVKPRK